MTTTPDIETLAADYEAAKAAAAKVHTDHDAAYRALWDTHNAAVQAMNLEYEEAARAAQQAETAAGTALLQAQIAAAEPDPEPEAGD